MYNMVFYTLKTFNKWVLEKLMSQYISKKMMSIIVMAPKYNEILCYLLNNQRMAKHNIRSTNQDIYCQSILLSNHGYYREIAIYRIL